MTHTSDKTVALTGATGFLGRYLIKTLVKRGYHVRALTRRPQTNQPGVTWIQGDVRLPESLDALAIGADIFIHAAGLTKALNLDEFRSVNKMGSWHALQAAKHSKVKKFIMVSSMAAREPGLSHYARSKMEGDHALTSFKWPFDWMIIRPGGIYGPGDTEFLPMFKLAAKGFMVTAGGKNNRFALIHGADMATIIADQIDQPFTQTIYEADDRHPNGYQAADLAEIFTKIYDRPIRLFNIPAFLLKIIGTVNSLRAFLTRKAQFITHKKANELTHTDWSVHQAAKTDSDIQYTLQSGFDETYQWYKENQLL